MLVDQNAFLVRLTELYQANRSIGTVYMTMKRFSGKLAHTRKRRPEKMEKAAEGVEPRLLIRAHSNKKKSKISTVVEAKELTQFQLALGNIVRQQMEGLKTREKSKEERKKEREQKQKAKEEKAAQKAAKPVKKDADAEHAAASGSKKGGKKKK